MKTENQYFILDRPIQRDAKHYLSSLKIVMKYAFFRIKYTTISARVVEKRYKVSVCVIFKNEAPYLREWIEYNHITGIDHFYMYNNNSEDDFMTVLKPYIESGLVTLLEWSHDQKQTECYIDCIDRFSTETKWIGFIDIDEFIVPKSTNSIYDFLRPFEKKRGSVIIYWKLFGSSAKINRDLSGLVTEDFTVCWPKYCDIGKCFYNTAFDFNKESKHSKYLHHEFWANWKGMDIPPVNIFDKVCIGNINIVHTSDFPVQINHYFTKSFKEYEMKKSKGDVYFSINPHDEEYFYEHEMKCTAVDYSAYKYIVKVKQAIMNKGVYL